MVSPVVRNSEPYCDNELAELTSVEERQSAKNDDDEGKELLLDEDYDETAGEMTVMIVI